MTSPIRYTVLDGTTHVIGLDEHTVDGLPIPHGNGYTTDPPKKLCPDCRKAIKGTDEFGASPEPEADASATA